MICANSRNRFTRIFGDPTHIETADTMASTLPSDELNPPRGSTWTVIGGIAVFGAILLSVCLYIFPRLGQEPVSATAALEFRQASAEPRSNWDKITLPDGETCFLSTDVTLSASDFRAFQYRPNSQPPEIVLLLSSSGVKQLERIRTGQGLGSFVVLLHHNAVAEVTSNQWNDGEVTLLLRGMSNADCNEVLARLTE